MQSFSQLFSRNYRSKAMKEIRHSFGISDCYKFSSLPVPDKTLMTSLVAKKGNKMQIVINLAVFRHEINSRQQREPPREREGGRETEYVFEGIKK